MCDMYVCAGVKTHVCVWRPEEDIGCLVLLAGFEARLPDGKPQESPVSAPALPGLQAYLAMPTFFPWVVGFELLPAEPPPQLPRAWHCSSLLHQEKISKWTSVYLSRLCREMSLWKPRDGSFVLCELKAHTWEGVDIICPPWWKWLMCLTLPWDTGFFPQSPLDLRELRQMFLLWVSADETCLPAHSSRSSSSSVLVNHYTV